MNLPCIHHKWPLFTPHELIITPEVYEKLGQQHYNLVARIILMFIADDVALAVICYVFLNIRQTALRAVIRSVRLAALAQRCRLSRIHAGGQRAFMQAASSLLPRGADQRSLSTHSCRLLVLSDLLVVYTKHCTDANRRETMPKQHSVTCLVQCVHVLQLAGLRVVGGRLELHGLKLQLT